MKTKLIALILFVLIGAGLAISQPGPISPFILRFLDMTDTPSAYTGQSGKYIKVNAGEDAVEFGTPAGAGDLLADGSVPMTANWDIGNFDITLKSLTGDGTIEGATITEGGLAVYNANEAAAWGALHTFNASAVFKNGATSAGFIDIYEDSDDGGNKTRIQAVAQAGDIVYSLPPDDGDAGEQLQTDGSGVLTWEAAGGGGDPVLINTVAIADAAGVDFTNGTGITITLNAGASPDTATIAATLGTNIEDAEVDNNITIDLATLATTVTITDNENTAENNPIVFVENGDLDGGNLGLESDGDLYYTPSTGVVTATGFAGALTGNVTGNADTATTAALATTVTITDNENTAENNPLVFVENGDLDGGNLGLESDGDAYYTPSTGVITATGFAGALTGNVTGDLSGNATTATTASVATTVTITDNENTAENNPLVFVENGDLDGGNLGLESDGDAYYTPSTGKITATGFVGALTGNADTATTATTANAGDSATAYFSAGTIEHEWGGLEANVSAYNGFVKISGGATSAVTANAGTDITADLEEEAHASEHAVSAADTIFPADPDADQYLMWDDDPGVLVWGTPAGAGDMLKAVYDIGATGGVNVITTVDSTYASDYVVLVGAATGQLSPKTDGGLTYDSTSGTLSATVLTEGGVAVYNSGETPGGILGGTWASPTIDADGINDTHLDWGAGANQIDLADIPGGIAAGATTWDFGGAASLEIVNGTDPDVAAAGQISNDTDGANETGDVSIRAYDGSNQFLVSRKLKTIQATIIQPQDLADATRDQCPIWHNNTGMVFNIVEIWAWSDTDDTSVNVEVVTATDFSSPATVDALEIATDGTSVYYVTETVINDSTIAHDEIIVLDFDDTDAPGWVKINIVGWFNADID